MFLTSVYAGSGSRDRGGLTNPKRCIITWVAMKRLARTWPLLIGLAAALCAWLALRSTRDGPLLVRCATRTAGTASPGSYEVQITNLSSHAYAYGVETEALVGQSWTVIRPRGLERYNSTTCGWLPGHSQCTVQITAPDSQTRFELNYERVPTRVENWVSWAFTWAGVKYPLSPRSRHLTVYPQAR